MAEFLPPHLRKYVVTQNYEKYTPVDQACWRYILRQLKNFLSTHAHECYVEGLEKSGIEVEEIPRIENISKHIEKFGWRALPVSGFIPPAAFMELQSLSVLPIASDMRSLEHLMYTPAPDIVHEAAGHAPILVNPEFAEYLKKYSQVAKKAILSKEDLDLYEAIRELSDIKENPTSTAKDIATAEERLNQVSKSMSHVSEGAELSRMNWWTAEYGLIGDLDSPKIYGAGLLSSVGESKHCLSSQVKKIPLTVECIKQGYDITEPQPQLFVTPDFKTLSTVLEDMANLMAFRKGGAYGLDKAIQAQSVNSIELDSGLQISGVIKSYKTVEKEIAFIKLEGPTQLCITDKELPGHSKNYHQHGYSTPLGKIQNFKKSLFELNSNEIATLQKGTKVEWVYESGIQVKGIIKDLLIQEQRLLLVSLDQCQVVLGSEVLFSPDWGTFDLATGAVVKSVFGGPADRLAYGEMDDFVAKRVPQPQYTEEQKNRFQLYSDVRSLRKSTQADETQILTLLDRCKNYPQDWLLLLELLEICYSKKLENSPTAKKITAVVEQTKALLPPAALESLEDGLLIVGKSL